jgi:hypothetical protein
VSETIFFRDNLCIERFSGSAGKSNNREFRHSSGRNPSPGEGNGGMIGQAGIIAGSDAGLARRINDR